MADSPAPGSGWLRSFGFYALVVLVSIGISEALLLRAPPWKEEITIEKVLGVPVDGAKTIEDVETRMPASFEMTKQRKTSMTYRGNLEVLEGPPVFAKRLLFAFDEGRLHDVFAWLCGPFPGALTVGQFTDDIRQRASDRFSPAPHTFIFEKDQWVDRGWNTFRIAASPSDPSCTVVVVSVLGPYIETDRESNRPLWLAHPLTYAGYALAGLLIFVIILRWLAARFRVEDYSWFKCVLIALAGVPLDLYSKLRFDLGYNGFYIQFLYYPHTILPRVLLIPAQLLLSYIVLKFAFRLTWWRSFLLFLAAGLIVLLVSFVFAMSWLYLFPAARSVTDTRILGP